ncbi:DUF397 domain-containing protein [Streptomyces sp. MST-110588]|uniref:DUF397 domain-containing protein n=1 Tax=Streptomyces sp. MST-110588 TaxID=2833628 RepID=UPI0032429F6A
MKSTLQWLKSSHSDAGGGNCVEVASGAAIHVRDSKDPSGPILTIAPDAWVAFVGMVVGATGAGDRGPYAVVGARGRLGCGRGGVRRASRPRGGGRCVGCPPTGSRPLSRLGRRPGWRRSGRCVAGGGRGRPGPSG